jgi:hypothetical protein
MRKFIKRVSGRNVERKAKDATTEEYFNCLLGEVFNAEKQVHLDRMEKFIALAFLVMFR